MKTRAIIKKFFQGLLVLALVLVLIGLGKWQLDRAAIVKESNAAAKVSRSKRLYIRRISYGHAAPGFAQR
jgi:cytochrome oxidase assembly protein ShyY1